MGPIALFDKSFIEMLNLDEAALFDVLFSTNICPIYYVEVLADLEKENPGQREREKVVGDVAKKTPILHAYPNVSHASMCVSELLGRPIEMRRAPVVAGGKPVRHEGEIGLVHEQSPEAKAFERWQKAKFLELEREFASRWRAQLKGVNYAEMAALVKQMLKIHATPKNIDDAFMIAKEVVHGEGQRFLTLKTAYALLGLEKRLWNAVQQRWKEAGRPPLPVYAPYTAHCLLVEVFFHVAVDKKLISPDRASNRTDIAYLYYLPFAMMFVSNDKLHRRTVPLFLNDKQSFVIGDELKKDLQALDAHYSALTAEEKAQGLFAIASRPPDDDQFMTTRIWKRFGMEVGAKTPFDHDANKKVNDQLLAKFNKIRDAAKLPQGRFTWDELADPSHITIERLMPLERGKWRIMPPGVEGDAE